MIHIAILEYAGTKYGVTMPGPWEVAKEKIIHDLPDVKCLIEDTVEHQKYVKGYLEMLSFQVSDHNPTPEELAGAM